MPHLRQYLERYARVAVLIWHWMQKNFPYAVLSTIFLSLIYATKVILAVVAVVLAYLGISELILFFHFQIVA